MHTIHYLCTNNYFRSHILPQSLLLSLYFILVAFFCLLACYQKILKCWMKCVLQNLCLGQTIVICLDSVTYIITNIIIKFTVHCLTPQSDLNSKIYQFYFKLQDQEFFFVSVNIVSNRTKKK
jgi:hypothetical protein